MNILGVMSEVSNGIENPASRETLDKEEVTALPLSDLQQAYWIGEEGGLRLSTPAFRCKSYFAAELDFSRLARALRTLLERHPMLRCRVTQDGKLVISEDISSIDREAFINYTDWTDEKRHDAFDPDRMAELDQRAVPKLGEPVKLKCCVHRVNGGFYVNLIIRLISVDGISVRIILSELASLYACKPVPETAQTDYRTYIAQKEARQTSPDAQACLNYWIRRSDAIPAAPELPTVSPSRFPRRSVFTRRRFVLSGEQSQRIARQARICGVSLTQFFCAAYIDILRMWSENKTFMLNVLISKRPLDDESFQFYVGSFSDTLLLESTPSEGSFRRRAGAVREQFLTAMDYSELGSVALLRRLGKISDDLPVLPVVFASTLGSESLTGSTNVSELGWTEQPGSLNTPQVYLDHQVMMEDGSIVLNWDSVDAVFNDGVVEQMFSAYQAHVLALTDAANIAEETCSPTLNERHTGPRTRANATERVFPENRLDALFDQAARTFPHNAAIVCEERTIDYASLHRLTTSGAHRLVKDGAAPGSLVAIIAEKSWRQVAAAVSIVKSGAAYLPLSTGLPPARLAYLLATQGLKVILADRGSLAKVEAPAGVTVLAIEDLFESCESAVVDTYAMPHAKRADDLAYIIFTSGSTGQPKGVAITHRAAANTIQDCVGRFRLTQDDRVIGVSALNFDLSVFDIFGTLACGAALVLPSHGEHPSPEAWVRCFRDHRVTVWNTVPALFEMLLEFTQPGNQELLKSLRLVMLSGDWIPLPLVRSIQSLAHPPTLIGLGGATEAAIWSNFFPVEELVPDWTSVPYGWPLANQQYRVLDENLNDVPTWVSGQLHISGVGLAREYYGDTERTQASFITHPSGQRMYRTGDYGRYLPDGSLEFLGRRDAQVKIRGHRIGIGEIDAALASVPGIKQSLTLVQELPNSDRRLVSFYQSAPDSGRVNNEYARSQLADQLPHYMIPGLLVEVGHFPVTSNGKVDKTALLALAQSIPEIKSADLTPADEIEQQLLELWESVLQIEVKYVNRDFFDLGGNSLSAVRLQARINAHFAVDVQLSSLLRLGTIVAQAKMLRSLAAERLPASHLAPTAMVRLKQGEGPILLLIHPVGGNVLCYRLLTTLAPRDVQVLAFQSPGDGRPRSIETLARTYASEFLQTQLAARQVYLLGWSMGGIVALELARVLEEEGVNIAAVTLLDSWCGGKPGVDPAELKSSKFIHGFFRDLLGGADPAIDTDLIATCPAPLGLREISDLVRARHPELQGISTADIEDLFAEYSANYDALLRHRPQAPHAPVVHYVATRTGDFRILQRCTNDLLLAAAEDALPMTTMYVDEDHHSIVKPAAMQRVLGAMFRDS
jgi:amino acid adenylation domain-containing protein